MQAVAKPAPYRQFSMIWNSTARFENYPWMTPAPGISRYAGNRRAASLDQIKYTIENLEYDATLSVPTRDIEDDLVGGYPIRMKDISEKAKEPFESRLAVATLQAGTTGTAFDGTAFFATSHNLGGAGAVPSGFTGGGNRLKFTAASGDTLTHAFILMVTNNGVVKPIVYQKRKAPVFRTDAGTEMSYKAKIADYWIDLEAAAGYGYWWDAIRVDITNTPTLIELFQCIDAARQQMRTFTLPIALATDPVEYVHEQTQFTPDSSIIACSIGLEQMFNHLLYEDRVGVSVPGSNAGITSNIYFKQFALMTSNLIKFAS